MKVAIEKFLANHTAVIKDGQFVYTNLPAQGLVDAINKTLEEMNIPTPGKKKRSKKKKADAPREPATSFPPST